MEDAAVSTNRLWIITGAAGFLGSTLVRELLSRGETVRALVHGTKPQPSLDEFDCEIVPIDVTDESTLTTPFEVSELDYHPRELRETLADTVTWLLRDAGFPNE